MTSTTDPSAGADSVRNPYKPKVALAHPGNATFVRHSAQALLDRGMLDYFATTFVDHPEYYLSRFFSKALTMLGPQYAELAKRRAFPEVPKEKLRTYPLWELARTLCHRLNRPVMSDAVWELGEKRFTAHVARNLRPPTDAVYTYEFAALEILQAAKRFGMLTFYEQPSQHHKTFDRIYGLMRRDYPEAISDATATVYAEDKRSRRTSRLDEELRLADWVLCNSSYTRRTLVEGGVPEGKILVTPYGFPEVHAPVREATGPVAFLNAGTLNVRKGLHILYAAWRNLSPALDSAELHLVGNQELPEALFRDLPGRVTFLDRIPHQDLMALYHQVDVFVLPTLAEGFGMVITEAMSRGVPVITTTESAGPDIIEHGVNGWLIPPGDIEALEGQMRWCIEHRHLLPEIGRRAAETARGWQWGDYRRALADKIEEKVRAHRHG